MRVGVISDTHGLLRPEAVAALTGVDRILHAGDIGAPGLVEALARIAPVTAIRGNVDTAAWALAFPEQAVVDLAGIRVLVVHDRKRLGALPETTGVVVSGHSHRPSVEWTDGILHLNPGAAGPRRFHLPVTLALLQLGAGPPRAEVVVLPV